MTPDEYCQNKAARSGSSFYYSFLFLPPPRRRAITALYAFCREVDDVVDEIADRDVAGRKLAWWRSEIERLFAGAAQHPVTLALAPHIERHGLERRLFLEIIDGMQMDLEQNRYLDFEGLRLYCHRVAGVVGCLASGVFGARDPGTHEFASRLGLALQLTNIIRDVGEDARKGRVYLPLEDLQRFDVTVQDVLQRRDVPGFVPLMQFQAQRARATYGEAAALLPEPDRRAQRPSLVMASIYRALLHEIEADGFRVLDHRVALTPLRKLWLAWRSWRRAAIIDA